jgi:hypothetical protein
MTETGAKPGGHHAMDNEWSGDTGRRDGIGDGCGGGKSWSVPEVSPQISLEKQQPE